MMKYLILNSIIIILVLQSCAGHRYSAIDFIRIDSIPAFNKPFDLQATSYKFKSEINIYNNYLTGMLIVKQEVTDKIRAILLTEMGVKIFDISIRQDSWEINYTIEPINRNKLFELIAKDMRLLFFDYKNEHEYYSAIDSENNSEIIKIEVKNIDYYYSIDSENRLLKSIESFRSNNPEIACLFSYSDVNKLDSVRINHNDADIDLNLIILHDE